MTLIIGSEGSMGKRYQAILRWLCIPFESYDIKFNDNHDLSQFSHFILATPTETHYQWIKKLDQFERPILCEKPLSKVLAEVREILNIKSPLTMMMQYKYLDQKDYHLGQSKDYVAEPGPRSSYNYFRHGNDGLVWDCFQIIALAKGTISLLETSPVWQCMINGFNLDIAQMDRAYISAVHDFYAGKYFEREKMLAWHEKVSFYANKL
jgi:hypothetical protein